VTARETPTDQESRSSLRPPAHLPPDRLDTGAALLALYGMRSLRMTKDPDKLRAEAYAYAARLNEGDRCPFDSGCPRE
jgi:hypothetical protein